MTEKWVTEKSISGGRVVHCRLCGRSFRRTFMAAGSNYAEALRAAEGYAARHDQSPEHKAALAAFHAPEVPSADSDDDLLRALGVEPRTEEQRRRSAARTAAERLTSRRGRG